MSKRLRINHRRSRVRDKKGGAINAGSCTSNLVRMAVGTLNQWSMDFKGNRDRIKKSITDNFS